MEAAVHATTQKEEQSYKVMPIMISLLISGFIGMFSETALNIALSQLMEILHITPATAQAYYSNGSRQGSCLSRRCRSRSQGRW